MSGSHGTIRVLHVDDDDDFAAMTAAMLERRDDRFVVETATSAAAALNQLDDPPLDCIVSDYEMPGMDGLEFLETVRETHPDLPFVLLTGRGSEAVAGDAIAAGVTDYLRKGQGTERFDLLSNRLINAVEAHEDAQRANRQEELMRLTEFAGDTGGWELDLATDEFRLTDGARRLAGRSERTLTREAAVEQFHPDDRADVRTAVDRAVEERVEINDTWRLQTAEGDERLVDVTIVPVVENDDVTLLRGSIHDVTEHLARERRFRAFVERSSDIISVIDEDGRFQYQSPSVERVFGYEPEETLGDSAFEYIHPDDRVEAKATFERVVANPDAQPKMEYRARHADGSWRWVETRGNNRLDDPAVEGYVINIRDITERKRRETAIRRLKAQYQTLVENVPGGGIFLFDENLQYKLVGGTELSAVGLSPADFEGSTPHDLFPEPIADELAHYFREALAGNEHVFEQHLDGKQYLIRTFPIRNDEGEVVSGMAISQDITERRERERRLERQNERLEEFTSVVSHDLRNPLNVAQGRLALITEACPSATDDIETVERAMTRMETLIDDLLALAHTGEEVGDVEAVALGDVVQQCWGTVATGGATLEVATDLTILADRSRLEQLFENLIRNAVEHGTPTDGGSVAVTVGALDDGDGFYLADDGDGIPPAHRGRVFETGYSTAADGTGFGLRIVKRIVDAHGWDIAVAESDSGGARFEVTDIDTP